MGKNQDAGANMPSSLREVAGPGSTMPGSEQVSGGRWGSSRSVSMVALGAALHLKLQEATCMGCRGSWPAASGHRKEHVKAHSTGLNPAQVQPAWLSCLEPSDNRYILRFPVPQKEHGL